MLGVAETFLRQMLKREPKEAEIINAAMLVQGKTKLPMLYRVGSYPLPSRQSGVAAVKRAARKARNQKKAKGR